MSLIHHIKEIIQEKYCITGILGKGGVAITYSAINLNSNSTVAIKVISLKQLEDWKQIELFHREAEVLRQLNCSGIPKYIDYFDRETDRDKLFYLVQELAPGKSLQQLIESGWRISEAKAKNIAQQILNILTYLHSLEPPVIHRDLKPSNIIYSNTGKIYLVDFGAVQNTYYNTLMQGSTVVGTYGYMSPEQFYGKALPATDLYSLGATLLYLLTHKSPGELPQDTLRLNFRNSVNISHHFADWLEKILEPDLADRFSNAEEALAELLQGNRSSQRKVVINYITLISSIFLLAGLNNYKWFFLGRMGYYPANICSSKVEESYFQKGGKIDFLGDREKLSLLSCMMKKRETTIIKQRISAIDNFEGIVNKLNIEGRTILHDAAVKERYEIIDLLLSSGADINQKSYGGISPLHFVLVNKKINVAQYLIDRGANVNNLKDEYDEPMLIGVMYNSNLDAAKLLIKNGADVNVSNRYGITPLLRLRDLRTKDKIETIELLLDRGADINARDHYGNNALFNVDNFNLAKLLIDRGIDINNKNDRDRTILFELRFPEIAQLLIDRGIDVNAKDKNGNTALFYVPNAATTKVLIDNGIEINHQSNNGETALFGIRDFATVKLLIEQGIEINARDRNGSTALFSIWSDRTAEFLIGHGAEVNLINDLGQTPLSTAIVKRNKPLVTLLLKHNADRRYLDLSTIEEIHNLNGKQKQRVRDFLDKNKF